MDAAGTEKERVRELATVVFSSSPIWILFKNTVGPPQYVMTMYIQCVVDLKTKMKLLVFVLKSLHLLCTKSFE